jgi:BlaI family penicillinase repressor
VLQVTFDHQDERTEMSDGSRKQKWGSLTAAEAEVMNVIWQHSPVSVSDIVQRIPRDLAYTTVMTTVRILQRKKFIKQCGKRGRAFMYKPVVTKKMVRESMSKELANRLFDGSLKLLMLDLVQHDGLSADELAEIGRAIEQHSETD